MSKDRQPSSSSSLSNNNHTGGEGIAARRPEQHGDINIDLTSDNNHNHNHRPHQHKHNGTANKNQYLVLSNAMRSYMDSLPDRLTIREELSRYQFWKSLRTEFIATFLFVIFTSGGVGSARHRSTGAVAGTLEVELSQLKNALALGLTAATLVQCTGHVSGCHLTIAITIGLYVSGRVSLLRLFAYLLVHSLASILGMAVAQCLFTEVKPLNPGPNVSGSQVFGFEFLATTVVVLTYLANCDPHRRDLGYKALSIGLAYCIAHLFASEATGAAISPARALAASLLVGTFYLHWIYWISPVLAGLFAGLLYEYIGSIKPMARAIPCNCNCNLTPSSATAELRHQFNAKVPVNMSTVSSTSSASASSSSSSSSNGRPNNGAGATIATISNGGNKNPSAETIIPAAPGMGIDGSGSLFIVRDEETEFSQLASSENFFERARY